MWNFFEFCCVLDEMRQLNEANQPQKKQIKENFFDRARELNRRNAPPVMPSEPAAGTFSTSATPPGETNEPGKPSYKNKLATKPAPQIDPNQEYTGGRQVSRKIENKAAEDQISVWNQIMTSPGGVAMRWATAQILNSPEYEGLLAQSNIQLPFGDEPPNKEDENAIEKFAVVKDLADNQWANDPDVAKIVVPDLKQIKEIMGKAQKLYFVHFPQEKHELGVSIEDYMDDEFASDPALPRAKQFISVLNKLSPGITYSPELLAQELGKMLPGGPKPNDFDAAEVLIAAAKGSEYQPVIVNTDQQGRDSIRVRPTKSVEPEERSVFGQQRQFVPGSDQSAPLPATGPHDAAVRRGVNPNDPNNRNPRGMAKEWFEFYQLMEEYCPSR